MKSILDDDARQRVAEQAEAFIDWHKADIDATKRKSKHIQLPDDVPGWISDIRQHIESLPENDADKDLLHRYLNTAAAAYDRDDVPELKRWVLVASDELKKVDAIKHMKAADRKQAQSERASKCRGPSAITTTLKMFFDKYQPSDFAEALRLLGDEEQIADFNESEQNRPPCQLREFVEEEPCYADRDGLHYLTPTGDEKSMAKGTLQNRFSEWRRGVHR